MGKSYEELFDEYHKTFKEIFPDRLAPSDITMQMEIMEECLRTGIPYDPDFDPECDY